jgi:putative two-component system response regulator
MDGSGYCRGLTGDALPELSRVLAVADVYDALSAPRPYRHALSPAEVFAIMDRDDARGFCTDCYAALKVVTCDGEVEPGGEDDMDIAEAA